MPPPVFARAETINSAPCPPPRRVLRLKMVPKCNSSSGSVCALFFVFDRAEASNSPPCPPPWEGFAVAKCRKIVSVFASAEL